MNSDIELKFQQAMCDAGIVINEIPVADGKLRRFHVEGDKHNSLNGWCVLYGDTNPKGCFGSWKTGVSDMWSLNDYREYTPQEKSEYARQMAEAKRERNKAQALARKKARKIAVKLWSEAKPANRDHRYLKNKGIEPHFARTDGYKLLISLRCTSGILHSIQYIYPNGEKRFLQGSAKTGHFFGVGLPKEKIIIAEGFSTMASIREALGYDSRMVAALDAGNLLPVAIAHRKKFPDTEIIIAADNDQWTDGNPGLTKATEAARAVNGRVVIPEFINTESNPTDFNDLATLEGLDRVKTLINSK